MNQRLSNTTNQRESGFTLMELMIVIAIIGILASVAVPQYAKYMNRSKFGELILATNTIKTAIAECYHWNGLDFPKCNVSVGSPGAVGQVTAAMLTRAASSQRIDSITVTPTGDNPTITVTPAAGFGLEVTDTYILTGETITSATGSKILNKWVPSGGGCQKNYC